MPRAANSATRDGLISVVLPTYNRKRVLARSIDSVLGQSYENLELIIVDDNSDDGSDELIRSYADNRIIYDRLSRNSGACAARNRGIELSRGKYIAFQDSDDEWRDCKLEAQLRALNEQNADLCFCRLQRHGYTENASIIYPMIEQGIVPYSVLIKTSIVSTQTILARKELFARAHFDIRLPRLQDYDWIISATEEAKVYLVDDVLVDVFLQEDSLTNLGHEKRRTSLETIYEKHQSVRKRYPEFDAELLNAIAYERTVTGIYSADLYLRLYKNNRDIKNLAKYILSKMNMLDRLYGLESRVHAPGHSWEINRMR